MAICARFMIASFLMLGLTYAADEDNPPCTLQFDTNLKCILDLVGSDNAKLIENKTKTVFHTTCAPDYPVDCFDEFEAAKECYVETKQLLDTAGPLKRQKDQANSASEDCLMQKSGSSWVEGLEEVFLPSPVKVISSRFGKALWGDDDAQRPILPSPLVGIMKGIGITTTPPPPIEKVLETGAESNTTNEGDDNKLFGRAECSPNGKAFMCTFKELNKLADTDPDFKNATQALKEGAAQCKKALQERCSPSTPEQNRCMSEAHIPLILAFVDNILDCMKGRGYTLPPILPRNFPRFSPRPKILQ